MSRITSENGKPRDDEPRQARLGFHKQDSYRHSAYDNGIFALAQFVTAHPTSTKEAVMAKGFATNKNRKHPLLDMATFHEKSAEQVCLALCPEYLPGEVASDPESQDHLAVERMLAKRLLRTAGFLRIVVERVLDAEKRAKAAGLGSEFTSIISDPETKKNLMKITQSAETF